MTTAAPVRSLTLLTGLITIVLLTTTAIPADGKSIAIVGAGFSGLSTAYYLANSKQNYTSITIFEQSRRVGGYATSFRTPNNVTFDLAVYAITRMYWRFTDVAHTLGFLFCPFTSDTVLLETHPPSREPTTEFLSALMFHQANVSSSTELRNLLADHMSRYSALWEKLFNMSLDSNLKSARLFPRKPGHHERTLLATPALTYLRAHDFDLIVPSIRLLVDALGYGPLETTPLLYLLTWVHPIVLNATLSGDNPASIPCDPTVGFEQIAQALADSLRPSVTIAFGSRVTSVSRRKNGMHRASVTINGVKQYFDGVVVTAKLPRRPFRSGVMADRTVEERRATESAEELQVYSALFQAPRAQTLAAEHQTMVLGRALRTGGEKRTFWTAQNARPRSGVPLNTSAASAEQEGDVVLRSTFQAYNWAREQRQVVERSESEKEEFAKQGLKRWDGADWRTVTTVSFDGFFQRWRPYGVRKGFPWTLQNLQGAGDVYFVNAAACGMESVGNLFDCAHDVVQGMSLQ